MTEWKPILLSELYDQIQKTEADLNGELWNFWQLIKIDPKKWTEKDYGNEGGGFWVVKRLFDLVKFGGEIIGQAG